MADLHRIGCLQPHIHRTPSRWIDVEDPHCRGPSTPASYQKIGTSKKVPTASQRKNYFRVSLSPILFFSFSLLTHFLAQAGTEEEACSTMEAGGRSGLVDERGICRTCGSIQGE